MSVASGSQPQLQLRFSNWETIGVQDRRSALPSRGQQPAGWLVLQGNAELR